MNYSELNNIMNLLAKRENPFLYEQINSWISFIHVNDIKNNFNTNDDFKCLVCNKIITIRFQSHLSAVQELNSLSDKIKQHAVSCLKEKNLLPFI